MVPSSFSNKFKFLNLAQGLSMSWHLCLSVHLIPKYLYILCFRYVHVLKVLQILCSLSRPHHHRPLLKAFSYQPRQNGLLLPLPYCSTKFGAVLTFCRMLQSCMQVSSFPAANPLGQSRLTCFWLPTQCLAKRVSACPNKYCWRGSSFFRKGLWFFA